MLRLPAQLSTTSVKPRRVACRKVEVCSARKQQQVSAPVQAAPIFAAVASAMLLGAALPEDAMAARSGGRVGGSVSRTSNAPAKTNNTTVINNTTVVAPPMFGGFGFGFGFPVFMPIGFGFSGFFTIFVVLAVVSAIGAVVAANNAQARDNDFR